MDSEKYEVIYCEDDGEYRIYCDICDKLCIERFFKNQHKSQTHNNNTHKKKTISNKITWLKFDTPL